MESPRKWVQVNSSRSRSRLASSGSNSTRDSSLNFQSPASIILLLNSPRLELLDLYCFVCRLSADLDLPWCRCRGTEGNSDELYESKGRLSTPGKSSQLFPLTDLSDKGHFHINSYRQCLHKNHNAL